MMKTSCILLLLSALLIGLKVVKPELTGILLLNTHGEPKNNMVRFWREKFDHKSFPEMRTEDFKHLKLEGETKINVEILPEDSTRTALFLVPGSQTYEKIGDTLVIRGQRNLRDVSYTRIYGNVESILVSGGVEVLINEVNQAGLAIHVKDKSKLKMNSDLWVNRLLTHKDKGQLEFLTIKAEGESYVELKNLEAVSVLADVRNSMLMYGSDLATDTLQVNLSGKSNVRAMNPAHPGSVNALVVSGNKTWFKPDLIGEGVELIEK